MVNKDVYIYIYNKLQQVFKVTSLRGNANMDSVTSAVRSLIPTPYLEFIFGVFYLLKHVRM